jgi:hypothetical protein
VDHIPEKSGVAMTVISLDIIREPRDEVLCRLIRAVARHASSVLLIERDECGLGESGRSLLVRLKPYLAEEKRTASWPGTKLLGREATMYRYAVNDEVVGELTAAASGLFAWRQPMLPEDIAFLRQDGSVVLASICHEHDAFLEITDEEHRSLSSAVPEIDQFARPAG